MNTMDGEPGHVRRHTHAEYKGCVFECIASSWVFEMHVRIRTCLKLRNSVAQQATIHKPTFTFSAADTCRVDIVLLLVRLKI